MNVPGAGWHVRSRAREPSAASKMSSTRSIRTCCQCGTRSGTPGPGAGWCNGWLITPLLTTALRTASCLGTQIPRCLEPVDAVTGARLYPRFAWRASAGSIRWRCEGAQQRGQFAVRTYVPAVERAAGRGRQAHRKGQQIRRGSVAAVGLGQEGELIHDPDNAAVRGLGEATVAHLPLFLIDDGAWGSVRGEHRGELLREPGQQGRRGSQRPQHRQQGRFVDEQRDLGLPEQGGGVPLAHHGGGLLPFTKVGRADAVEQFLGRAHDQHPSILPKPRPDAPAGTPVSLPRPWRDGALIDDDRLVNVTVLPRLARSPGTPADASRRSVWA